MRFVPIERAKAGMRLAKPIFDADHRVLLSYDQELTIEFINRLKKRGLPGFYIDDELTKDIIVNEAISEELRGRAINCLVNKDIDSTLSVATEIVRQLRGANSVSLDLIDLRTFDEYTYRHSVNVSILVTIVGLALGLSDEALVSLCTAAILHDIGKLSIDAEILNKPGVLTDEEREVMRAHSFLSYEMLKNNGAISAKTKAAVLQHHENMDGTGYPDGIKGDAIHPFARIIHVCDVYDALTTARPYKSAYSPYEATEFLKGGKGLMFDSKVVDIFYKFVPLYPKGTSVLLSNGEEVIIVENHLGNMMYPVVRFPNGATVNLADRAACGGLSIVRSADTIDNALRENRAAKKKRKNILAVDERISDLLVLNALLKDRYNVAIAKNASQTLMHLNKRVPDLIIMDVTLHDMDSVELIRKIRTEMNPKMPVIFATALATKATILKSRDANIQGFVTKPYKALYLQNAIAKALDESETRVI